MAVPKKKRSKARTGSNNAHNSIPLQNLVSNESGVFHVQHCAVKNPDGSFSYKGRTFHVHKPRTKKDSEG